MADVDRETEKRCDLDLDDISRLIYDYVDVQGGSWKVKMPKKYRR